MTNAFVVDKNSPKLAEFFITLSCYDPLPGTPLPVSVLQIEEQYIGRNKTRWAREEGGSSTFSTPAACPSRVDPALGPLSYIIVCARNKTVARYHAIQQN